LCPAKKILARGVKNSGNPLPTSGSRPYNTAVILSLMYNLVMLAADVAAIVLLRRGSSLRAWLGIMAAVAAVALVLGAIAGLLLENHFGVLRLWAYGVLLHGPLLLVASAISWRRLHPRLAFLAALAAVVMVAAAADGLLVEPHWLEVSHRRITSPKIHRPLRIVVLADLQTDSIGPYERRVLERVVEEKPDLILWAGDYLQGPWQEHETLRRRLRDLLQVSNLTAPLGAFAVRGNCDSDDWPTIFADLNVTTVDASRSFDLGDIQLTCLGMGDSFNTKLTISNETPQRFHLVLGHAPDFALGKIDADLCISGHTHGGQIRLPWLGPPVVLSRVPHSWAAGLTELPGGGKLLVSRGIGMERGHAPRIRFLCRPELLVIDLVPEEQSEK
jgi:uncharacterized protein